MTRSLRAFGLALLSAFALSAVTTSGAQASHIAWESGATTFSVEADPTEPSQLFTTTASNLTCNEVSATVTLPGGGGGTTETLETSSLKYDNNKAGKCVGTGGLEPKVEMNGCNYVFHAGATVTGGIEMTADLKCPEGKSIITNAGFLCTLKIGSQEGLTGITATNVKTGAKEEATIEVTSENIKYTHTGLCGNGSAEDGVYHGKVTSKAHTNTLVQMHTTVT